MCTGFKSIANPFKSFLFLIKEHNMKQQAEQMSERQTICSSYFKKIQQEILNKEHCWFLFKK